MTFRELEVAMDHAADQARREFLQSVTTPILRDALAKADRWGEVGLADLFAGELQRRDQEERALSDTGEQG